MYCVGMTLTERFLAKVRIDGPIPLHHHELGPCHIWTGCKDKDGYGLVKVAGKMRRATHVALEIATGEPIAPRTTVMHHCDYPPCVRPSHLKAATSKKNSEDMVAKGRAATGDRSGARKHPERLSRGDEHWTRRDPEKARALGAKRSGELHGMATLTRETVLAIRARRASGETQKAVAAAFNVNQSTVSRIVSGKRWRSVD
jgi:hypothetical protein